MNAVTRKLVQILETRKQKADQRGFTLLELLVVVAILAAIAGTATIALKDTDMRASAAAHVAMMDELNKGIRTYRVLKKNEIPSRFDSLLTTSGAAVATLGFNASSTGGDAIIAAIPSDVQTTMTESGMDTLMYLNTSLTGIEGMVAGVEDCEHLEALVKSRNNNVVAGNIFMPPAGNGCGTAVTMDGGSYSGVWWNGGSLRLTGSEENTSSYDAQGNTAFLITGIGPASTLFNANELGGMTTVPVYRHVKAHEYNRFMAVWNVGTYNTSGIIAGAQAELVAIVDGALDTKEEELGEWDGTRNTL